MDAAVGANIGARCILCSVRCARLSAANPTACVMCGCGDVMCLTGDRAARHALGSTRLVGKMQRAAHGVGPGQGSVVPRAMGFNGIWGNGCFWRSEWGDSPNVGTTGRSG
eukprot:3269120-Pyramimonas_sp.AAC.1